MIYFLNTHLPDKKKVYIALTQIYGLGLYQSMQICDELGIGKQKRILQLNPSELEALANIITQHYETGTEVRRSNLQNIQRLIKIGAYRGFRHTEGLPVRGQKTHGNSRTTRKLKMLALIFKK